MNRSCTLVARPSQWCTIVGTSSASPLSSWTLPNFTVKLRLWQPKIRLFFRILPLRIRSADHFHSGKQWLSFIENARLQIPKYFVGRLRPHFMDVCQPTPGYVCTTPNEYAHIFIYLLYFLINGHRIELTMSFETSFSDTLRTSPVYIMTYTR